MWRMRLRLAWSNLRFHEKRSRSNWNSVSANALARGSRRVLERLDSHLNGETKSTSETRPRPLRCRPLAVSRPCCVPPNPFDSPRILSLRRCSSAAKPRYFFQCVDQFASHGRILQQCFSDARHLLDSVLLRYEIFEITLALLPCAFSSCLPQKKTSAMLRRSLFSCTSGKDGQKSHVRVVNSQTQTLCGPRTDADMVGRIRRREHCVGHSRTQTLCCTFTDANIVAISRVSLPCPTS